MGFLVSVLNFPICPHVIIPHDTSSRRSKCRDPYFPVSLPYPSQLQGLTLVRPELTLRRWSVGSAMFLASFAAVMGPMNYIKHLFSGPRIPFTAGYFGSILLTLVFAIKVTSYLCICQVLTDARKAPEHDPHAAGCLGPNRLFDLVSCQLLSHGLSRSPSRHFLWRKTSRFMDECLIRPSGFPILKLIIIVYYLPYLAGVHYPWASLGSRGCLRIVSQLRGRSRHDA